MGQDSPYCGVGRVRRQRERRRGIRGREGKLYEVCQTGLGPAERRDVGLLPGKLGLGRWNASSKGVKGR